MRTVAGLILVAAVLSLVGGCAQRKAAVAAAPTPDEMPRLERLHTKIQQGTVGVETMQRTPRLTLVPSFEEPELTPEERAALGEQPVIFEPLLYQDAVRVPDSTAAYWFAGIETHAWGHGGAVSFQERATVVGGVSIDFESMEVGYGFAKPPAGTAYNARTAAGAAIFQEAGAAVAIDRPTEKAAHANRLED